MTIKPLLNTPLIIGLSSRLLFLFLTLIFPFLTNQTGLFYNHLMHYDAVWYQNVATQGYTGNAIAFFPLFPWLTHLLPLPFALSAFIINNLLFIFSVCLLFAYLRQIGLQNISLSTCLLLAFSPYAFYFSVPYSESLFLFLTLYLFYFAEKGDWLKVLLLAPFISATRNAGIFIVFPLGLIALKQFTFRQIFSFARPTRWAWLAICSVPLGLVAFMAYLYHLTGDALAFVHIQNEWERNGLFSIVRSFQENPVKELYHSFYFIVAISLVVYLLKVRYYAQAVWLAILATLGPLTGTFASEARYVMAGSPFIYMAFALFLANNQKFAKHLALICCLSASLFGFFTALWLIDGRLA